MQHTQFILRQQVNLYYYMSAQSKICQDTEVKP